MSEISDPGRLHCIFNRMAAGVGIQRERGPAALRGQTSLGVDTLRSSEAQVTCGMRGSASSYACALGKAYRWVY